MNKKVQRTKYIISDYLSAALSWTLFFIIRRVYIDSYYKNPNFDIIFSDENYLPGLITIPFFWLFLYSLQGYYKNIYRKSRLYELLQTILITFSGSLIIFFALLLDDFVGTYRSYYFSIGSLMVLHFLITYIPRFLITFRTNKLILKRKIGFNTLIIGGNKNATELVERINNRRYSPGNRFIGFVEVYDREHALKTHLPCLGKIKDIPSIIRENNIEEVIIAIESSGHKDMEQILNKLEGFCITIKAIPDNTDILSGKVKISSLFDEPFIQISHDLMPAWQEVIKRMMDIVVSIFVLVIFSPLFLFLAIGVKFSSKGPVIYSHTRIGKNGIPFTIYKFRSMYVGSEKAGPELAKENDDRITPLGSFMRKTRLDEIPQFYNVLKGDMALVGPRPEREFFIKQIVQKAPHYVHLHKVRPGITSWGQVKYGYAKNVDEMVKRLKYDIIYIENMSLYIDIKVLIYTIKTVLLGKGI